eukprot:PITA_06167
MSGYKNLFSTLEEKDLQMRIKMGDDGKYHVSGEGTDVFQREHGDPLTLNDVNYVPGLKKNIVSVSMLEDKGYDVVFSKGKVFLRYIGTGQTKQIEIQVKNLYNMELDDYAALSSKAEMVQSQDVGELWHKRLGHLHHGALKIMQQISTRLPKENWIRRIHAKVVPWVSTQNIPFWIETVELKQSWSELTKMFVDHSLQPPPLNKESEPSSFEEVMQKPVWVDAMVEEYNSVIWNSVWDVVPRPQEKSVVISRWLYKLKQAADGNVEKQKARFISRGFSQVEGIDYDETFAPVARYSSIRSMSPLSDHMGWKIH